MELVWYVSLSIFLRVYYRAFVNQTYRQRTWLSALSSAKGFTCHWHILDVAVLLMGVMQLMAQSRKSQVDVVQNKFEDVSASDFVQVFS